MQSALPSLYFTAILRTAGPTCSTLARVTRDTDQISIGRFIYYDVGLGLFEAGAEPLGSEPIDCNYKLSSGCFSNVTEQRSGLVRALEIREIPWLLVTYKHNCAEERDGPLPQRWATNDGTPFHPPNYLKQGGSSK
ncbi:hypothetical protein DFH06DRAFT_1130905 [Mycena polygramma]|nr:hypothetical protein DFH06DRAFT_1130905 [Mycena polygramma]